MRWLCLMLALAALAGCGDDRRDSSEAGGGTGDAATPPPSESAPPSPAAGGGGPIMPVDSVGQRLSKLCKKVQAELKEAPEPTEPKGAAANAERESEVLRALRKRLAGFDIDPVREEALEDYLTVLEHEIEVDELIATAGNAEDRPAVDDLNDQNGHNRAKRRKLALEELVAKGCRPGTRITD